MAKSLIRRDSLVVAAKATTGSIRHLQINHYGQWLRTTTSKRKTPYASGTIDGYLRAAMLLSDWLDSREAPGDLCVSPETLNAFFSSYRVSHSVNGTANVRRNLMVLFKWLNREQGHPNPFRSEDLDNYSSTQTDSKVWSREFIQEFLEDCQKDRTFTNVRDEALFRLLLDGPRVSQILAMTVEDVPTLDYPVLTLIPQKGDTSGHEICIPDATILALQRYLRVRAAHKLSHTTDLWLAKGRSEPLGYSGVRLALQRRAARLGYSQKPTPHMGRHTFTDAALEGRMPLQDVATHLGHSSTAMVDRVYAAKRKSQRSVRSRRALGDLF